MTTRYVGIGGSDASDGLSWANRKLTLTGAEDTPVVAGDTVYVGPGVYRELLTIDVSGTSGAGVITYIGDVTGENTDDVGGEVRISASDDDQGDDRASCITASSKDYRTFRGFSLKSGNSSTAGCISSNNGDEWIIEDCFIEPGLGYGVYFDGAASLNNTVRRCFIYGGKGSVYIRPSADADNQNNLIENCVLVGGKSYGLIIWDSGGNTVRSCIIYGCANGIWTLSLSAGQTQTVENCLIVHCVTGLKADDTDDITEDYNTVYGNDTARTNTNVGTNSVAWPPIFAPQLFLDSYMLPPPRAFELHADSQVARKTGSSVPADDLFGITRPTTASKKSWGPIQIREGERETTTTRGSSTASIKLADAGDHKITVPVTNESTVFSIYAYREASYSGSNPQLIIRQPGQPDDITTDAASAADWNELTTTLTPAATPPYIEAIFRSRNEHTDSGYAVYFDDFTIT